MKIPGAFSVEPFHCKVSSFLELADFHAVFRSQLRCNKVPRPESVPVSTPALAVSSIQLPTLLILFPTKCQADSHRLCPLRINWDSVARCSKTCSPEHSKSFNIDNSIN